MLVGWDFGSTVGVLYASIISSGNESVTVPELDYSSPQYEHLITNNTKCTNFSFRIYADLESVTKNVTIFITPVSMITSGRVTKENAFGEYCLKDSSACIHYTPIIINISLISCPIGFTLTDKWCSCYLDIFENCTIIDGIGYVLWENNA